MRTASLGTVVSVAVTAAILVTAATLAAQHAEAIEAGGGLDRRTRRLIQQGLVAERSDPRAPDGLFGPHTRAGIGAWQGGRRTAEPRFLDGVQAELLRMSAALAAVATSETTAPSAPAVAKARIVPASAAAQSPPPRTELEVVFWQSIANSTNPADFEAYLEQFPNGTFRRLAQNRLEVLTRSANEPLAATDRTSADAGAPVIDPPARSLPDPSRPRGWRAGERFQDCPTCPEMVVLPGSSVALGRYEVTLREYRAFVAATGTEAGSGCQGNSDSWRNTDYPRTDRHPVTCMSWEDAQAYVSWLSEQTDADYRLPTEAEWEQGASGSESGCYRERTGNRATCPVGSYGANDMGLFDMIGNVSEWMADCWERDCRRRVLRGGSFHRLDDWHRRDLRSEGPAGRRYGTVGIRVAKTLDAP